MPLTISASEDMDHIVWGIDTNHDPDDPTPVLLDAASLDDSFAGSSATVGGYGTIRATLTTTPVVVCGSGTQRHRGVWRHYARVYGTGTGQIWIRLTYKLGSSPRFSEGDWRPLQALGNFYEVDLGLMRVLDAPEGDRTCEFRFEAYSDTPGDTLAIHMDQLIPQPGGKAVTTAETSTANVLVATDSFNQTAGNLAAKVAPLGGTWSGAGDADDFTVDGTNHLAQRTAVSDASADAGRFARLGTGTATSTTVQVDYSTAGFSGGQGLFARWVDANNLLWIAHILGNNTLVVRKKVAGSSSSLILFGPSGMPAAATGQWYTLRADIGDDGSIQVWIVLRGMPFGTPLVSIDGGADFRSGGALASGGFGIYDYSLVATAYTRQYDNFIVSEPVTTELTDHVIYGDHSMQIRSDMVIREHPTNEWGRLPTEGAYLKVPPAGLEGRVSRLVIKARRNNVDLLPDDVIDDEISATLTVTPRVTLLGG